MFSAFPAIDSYGTLTYTPALDANGDATIKLILNYSSGTANGGFVTSAGKTFDITVNAVNYTPNFTAVVGQEELEDSEPQTITN